MNLREESKEASAITSLEEVEVKAVDEPQGGKQRSKCYHQLGRAEVKEVGEPKGVTQRHKCFHQLGRNKGQGSRRSPGWKAKKQVLSPAWKK